MKKLKTGMRVRLEAGKGTLTILEESSGDGEDGGRDNVSPSAGKAGDAEDAVESQS